MQTVQEKIAYLKGLIKGSDFYGRDENAKAVWEQMIAILDDLADSVDSLQANERDLEEYIETVDADLADLEEEFYGDDDLNAAEYIEVECPNCHELVSFEEDFLFDDDVEISCPECGEVIYVGDEYRDLEDYEVDDNRNGSSPD